MNTEPNYTNKVITKQEIDYLKLLKIFLSRWYWIAGFLLISLFVAYLYLRFTQPVYITASTIKFDDKKTELSELININNYYDKKDRIQTEVFVMQSRPLLLRAINRLNYKISFFKVGRVLESETYPEVPFDIDILKMDTLQIRNKKFSIKKTDPLHVKFSYLNSDKEQFSQVYKIGDTINFMGSFFRVVKSNLPIADNTEYNMYFNTNEGFLGRVGGGLSIREMGKGINILELSQKDKNPYFAANFLNALMEEYREYDREQKSLAASQTIDFIDNQLLLLAKQVKESEGELQDFKRVNNIISIETNKQVAYQNINDLEVQKKLYEFQRLSIDELDKQVRLSKDSISLSFSIDASVDQTLLSLISQLNILQTQKLRTKTKYTSEAKPVIEIENELTEVRRALNNSIRAARNRNNRNIAYLNQKLQEADSKLKGIPSTERDLINLQNKFDINQKIYTYLSEKRLEAAISKSAILTGATIVDPAKTTSRVFEPIPNKIYTMAGVIGIVVGLCVILIARVSNQKIYDKETIEFFTNVPILGIIRKFPDAVDSDQTEIVTMKYPKSSFSESVRSVRTNLSFISSDQKSKVVCVTSDISGEGKSFTVINLASTLAMIDKKIVVIDADLRRSKLHKTFHIKNENGLSEYLSNQIDGEKIVRKTQIENVDFIPAGAIPPNPAELLYLDRMRQLLAELKEKYDYVIIDTAPIGLVSDSISLIRICDIKIFVLRSGVSSYHAATVPDRISKEFGLNNVVIILNGYEEDLLHSRYYSTNYNTSYGAGYYYSTYEARSSEYYTDEHVRKPWWKFWQ